MAAPMSADRLLKALRDEGLIVFEVGDWRTHNRNHKGAWGEVHGVMIHHTVTVGTDYSVQLCYDGHSTLPGPLCHGVIDKLGRVHLVGYGRTNHAGLGDDDVLTAVKNESALPPDNEANTDGNRAFYGFECINLGDGKDPWPEAQLEAIEKTAAAICRVHQWSERSVIGHLEWQPGKVDPRGFTMAAMRARIADRIEVATPAPPVKPPAPAPIPAPSEGVTDMAIAKVDESNPIDVDLADNVWTTLAFTDAVIHPGPRRLVGPTYVQLTFAPGSQAFVTGRFILTNPDGTGASGYGDLGEFNALGMPQLLHNHDIPTGKTLRFQVKARTDNGSTTKLTHRVVTGDYLA